jgi:phospholipid/cholesterol/gamma-HCH transport system ATP-binding protein
MIKINSISKSFKDKTVLNSISGEFDKGKCNLIIGASGTGKSVLLKCIVGLLPPDSGNVYFDLRNFTEADKEMKSEIRREIGMLFQGGALFDSKNVEENIMFPLDILTKMSLEEKRERVNFCLKRVGLEQVNKKMPSEISGGMKKRVGIARAIVNNPNYLFCDEPNSGLDPQTSILIDELILEITHEFDITTVVVTHDMNSVMGIGEKIMFLYKGDKLWEGSNQEIMSSGLKELDDFVFTNKIMKNLKAGKI